MKCSSCGKEFDENKYYRICPKCGTYNNVVRQTPSVDSLEETDREREIPRQTRVPSGRKGLVIALILLLAVGVVEFTVSMVLVLWEDPRPDTKVMAEHFMTEAIQERPASLGQPLLLEEDADLELRVDEVEVICEADVFADFPQGQKLVGISLTCPGADISYDTYRESPLGSIYVGYGEMFKEALEGEVFKGYRSVTGDRTGFDLWEMRYGTEQTGYMYVFLPAEVTEGSVYVEVRDPMDGELTEIYQVDFALGEVQ